MSAQNFPQARGGRKRGSGRLANEDILAEVPTSGIVGELILENHLAALAVAGERRRGQQREVEKSPAN